MDLEGLVRPVVEAAGLELVDVGLERQAGRRVLRVTVDRDGGVDLDAISQAAERIGRRLDLEGFDPGPYSLEVGSPGLERPLRDFRDFARRIGETVKVKTVRPVEGARSFKGRLVAADLTEVHLATEAGERRVALQDLSSARTVFEWKRGAKAPTRAADRGKRPKTHAEGGER